MTRGKRIYYKVRAVEERQREAQAKDPRAAQAHAQMAERYEAMLRRSNDPTPIASLTDAVSG